MTLRTLESVLAKMDCSYEIIFVNDGSRDQSLAVLELKSAADPRIKVVSFSRNFGHQMAVTAGLDFASGDAVVVLDADLQDPPELLPKMVELYREGYDVVSPQRISRQGDSWFKRKTATLFYAVMQRLSDVAMPPEVGDFRLFSSGAVQVLRRFRERHRYMRGLVAWLGLREAFVAFSRQPRAAGETKYPLLKMLWFSWTAITSFSAMPLRLTMGLGMVTVGIAFGYLIYAVFAALVLKHVVWGWTSLVFLQCFFSGLTLTCIGLIGDYIARIYEEAKGRPLYVVNRMLNLSSPSDTSAAAIVEPSAFSTK